MDYRPDLMGLGLTDGEARVYLALIRLGASTVGPISKESGVTYSNVYDILERLMKKGIASYMLRSKTKYYQASGPEQLEGYLHKKELEISEQKDRLRSIMPSLLELQKNTTRQDAEMFIGIKGIKAAYAKLFEDFKTEDENLVFYIHDPAYSDIADRTFVDLTEMIGHTRFRAIFSASFRGAEAVEALKHNQKAHYELRYVDFPIPGNMEICGERMLLVSWTDPIIAVLIRSRSMAQHFKDYFESVWQIAEP
ncbi:MAG: TrmB family transcriptional regulator [Nanobdellota archaeon]